MESLVGAVVAIVMSFGYTEIRMRKYKKKFDQHVEEVNTMEQTHARNMIATMMPMSKAVRELQETVGVRSLTFYIL